MSIKIFNNADNIQYCYKNKLLKSLKDFLYGNELNVDDVKRRESEKQNRGKTKGAPINSHSRFIIKFYFIGSHSLASLLIMSMCRL